MVRRPDPQPRTKTSELPDTLATSLPASDPPHPVQHLRVEERQRESPASLGRLSKERTFDTSMTSELITADGIS